MRARGTGEDGMALLVVMVLMGVMLTAGFAIASTVDTQTSASLKQRTRDSAFNLAESALNAQVFTLGRDFPGVGRSLPGQRYDTCTPTTVSPHCPDNASLVQGGSPDLVGATWQTSVRDNGPESGKTFYSDALSASQPGYDANNDGKVWVRAQGIAKGRTRTLVGLVRVEKQEEDVPRAALIAGSVDFTNNAPNKPFVTAGSGTVALRCDPLANPRTTCLGQVYTGGSLAALLADVSRNIVGATPSTAYAGATAMTPEAVARLKATAIASGTYYPGCPTEAQLLVGGVAYVEDAGSNCSYTGTTHFNAPPLAPGVLIINRGTVTFGGNTEFYGLIYHLNAAGSTGVLVATQGGGRIIGGVLIDGAGQMQLGSSENGSLQYDVNAFRAVVSYGSAGVIQNTFREIRAG